MMNTENNRVCPVEYAGALDSKLRKLIQNPRKILGTYIKKDMNVLDFGCGPGFFSIEIAKMVDGSGKVIAVDLQKGMLEKIKNKISGTVLEEKIQLHQCSKDSIGLTEMVDFILAFYVIHEMPDQEKIFKELSNILKPKGRMLIVEPKFHVNKKAFENMLSLIEKTDFKIINMPKLFFSRAVLIQL